jgi:putative DNA primase/helicase
MVKTDTADYGLASILERHEELNVAEKELSSLEEQAKQISDIDLEKRIMELSVLPPIEYDRQRQKAAEELGIRVSTLDKVVDTARPQPVGVSECSGTAILYDDPVPWPNSVDGNLLIELLTKTYGKYVVLPEHAALSLSLWTIHSHAHAAATVSPVLAVESPEMRCGKTTLLGVIGGLVPRLLATSNVTTAALFRAVEKWCPTLLIDEADTFLKNSDELRGVLNSGHTRALAYVIRTVGDDHEPRRFRTWCPKAIALIGTLPSTLRDRSIEIRLRRRKKDEKVAPWRADQVEDLTDLRRQCARWVIDKLEHLQRADPTIPVGLHDRAADNWRPLLAIAEAIGGEWLKKAHLAAQALSVDQERDDTASALLLNDLKALFDNTKADRFFSRNITDYLVQLEERPWPEWKNGKPITVRQLARLLNPFDITPTTIRIGSETAKGYLREQFLDVFARYLPQPSDTPSQHAHNTDSDDHRSVTPAERVTDEKTSNPTSKEACSAVTDQIAVSDQEVLIDDET